MSLLSRFFVAATQNDTKIYAGRLFWLNRRTLTAGHRAESWIAREKIARCIGTLTFDPLPYRERGREKLPARAGCGTRIDDLAAGGADFQRAAEEGVVADEGYYCVGDFFGLDYF